MNHPISKLIAISGLLALGACGSFDSLGFGGKKSKTDVPVQHVEAGAGETIVVEQKRSFLVFGGGNNDSSQAVQVNKYIWNAALDVLGFLPIQTADPFTGAIVTGYGTPPGGGRSYRATIHITDAALDARSLHVSLYTSGGQASAETTRAVEDAILTRARQMRSGSAGL